MAFRPDNKTIAGDPKLFREKVRELYQLPDHDWTDWELDWFESMLRRDEHYKHSEKEQAKLIELNGFAETYSEFNGIAIHKLIALAHRYRLDLTESDIDFVEGLMEKWRASILRKRQMRRLVRILEDMDEIVTAA